MFIWCMSSSQPLNLYMFSSMCALIPLNSTVNISFVSLNNTNRLNCDLQPIGVGLICIHLFIVLPL